MAPGWLALERGGENLARVRRVQSAVLIEVFALRIDDQQDAAVGFSRRPSGDPDTPKDMGAARVEGR